MTKINNVTKLHQQKYDQFISGIPIYLDQAKQFLKKSYLTYSDEEINTMHKLFISKLDRPEIMILNANDMDNMFCAYVGEAFLHYHPGRWSLSTIKKDAAFGKPIIIDWTPPGRIWVRICPFEWMLSIKENKFEGQLSEVITWKYIDSDDSENKSYSGDKHQELKCKYNILKKINKWFD